MRTDKPQRRSRPRIYTQADYETPLSPVERAFLAQRDALFAPKPKPQVPKADKTKLFRGLDMMIEALAFATDEKNEDECDYEDVSCRAEAVAELARVILNLGIIERAF